MRKELFENYFKGKKITVMGLGLLGRGIGDTHFLAEHGAHLIVTDKKTESDLTSSLQALRNHTGIEYHLGKHDLSDFEERDFILKAAGVPYNSEYILHAKNSGVPVYMSAALVVDIVKKQLKDVTVIGITGTRGKTTTTELIAYVLEQAGKRVHRGGNIRGVANLPLLEAIEEGEYLVLELDSWQLQGFGDMTLSPDIAVFTSFLDDHLNYYGGDKELYFNDKAQIFLHQKKPFLIASSQAQEEITKRYPDQAVIVPPVEAYGAKIIGSHNDVSISLAIAVATRLGIDEQEAKRYAQSFSPVQGRLENLGLFRGVTVYNDNNATTPDAVVAGLTAVTTGHNKRPILIMGGADKGLDVRALETAAREQAKAVVLLSGTGTDTLTLSKEHMFERLEECIQAAFSLAEQGDIILFSPGFASFSKYFNNEYERNDTFIEELKKYA